MPVADPMKRRIAMHHLLEKKICRKCGATLPPNAKKCRKCRSKDLRPKRKLKSK